MGSQEWKHAALFVSHVSFPYTYFWALSYIWLPVSRARPAAVDLPWLLSHHDKQKYVGRGDPVYVIRWTLNAPAGRSPVRFLPRYITPLSAAAPLVKTEQLNSEERNRPKSWPWAFLIPPLKKRTLRTFPFKPHRAGTSVFCHCLHQSRLTVSSSDQTPKDFKKIGDSSSHERLQSEPVLWCSR